MAAGFAELPGVCGADDAAAIREILEEDGAERVKCDVIAPLRLDLIAATLERADGALIGILIEGTLTEADKLTLDDMLGFEGAALVAPCDDWECEALAVAQVPGPSDTVMVMGSTGSVVGVGQLAAEILEISVIVIVTCSTGCDFGIGQ